LKDENITLITKLEESTTKIIQLEAALEQRAVEHRSQITNIEHEIQKYLGNKVAEHE
jgi:hypothetical protein